ncbi:MAG: hypothetical protein IJN42_05515, partial [Clostridia bacterium]|nr:hypothetical protein [Clostridia bacterium]
MSIDIDDIVGDSEQLKEIKLRNDILRDQLELTDGTRRSVPKTRAFAKRLLDEYESSYSYADLSDDLISLYKFISERVGGSTVPTRILTEITQRANAIAKRIVDNEKTDWKLTEDAAACLDQMKKTKVYFDPSLKSEAVYMSGSWSDFQKAMKGTVRVTTKQSENAIPADTFMEELAAAYPQFFKSNYNVGDIPSILLSAARVLRASTENGWREMYNTDEAIYEIGQEIISEYAKIPVIYTLADRQQQRLDDLNRRFEQAKERVQRERKRYENAIEREKNALEYKAKEIVIGKLQRISSDFTKRVMRPSERVYVPDEFKLSLIRLLKVIDFSSNGERANGPTAKDIKKINLNAELTKIADIIEEKMKQSGIEIGDESFGTKEFKSYDPEVVEKLRLAAAMLKDKNINRSLSLAELNTIYEGLHGFQQMIMDVTRLDGKRKNIEAYEIRRAGLEEVMAAKRKTKANGKEFKNWLARLHTLGTGSILKAITGYNENSKLWSLWQDIEQSGLNDEQNYIMNAEKMFAPLRNSKEMDRQYKKATEIREWTVRDSRGNPVKMSQLTAAALVMTWRREMSNDRHVHLSKGGALIPDAKLLQKGNYKAAEANGQLIPKMDANTIKLIEAELSSYARRWMDTANKYFNEYSSPMVNKISQELYHRDIATNDNYIPYYVYGDGRVSEVEGMQVDARLESSGRLKQLEKGAAQPLVILSLDQTVDKHIGEMAPVIGYTIPVRNFSKVWGGLLLDGDLLEADAKITSGATGINRTLKSIVAAQFGQTAVDSVEKTLVELAGGGKQSKAVFGMEKAVRKLTQHITQSIFFLNLSVGFKQVTSYFAAGNLLNLRSLATGLVHIER